MRYCPKKMTDISQTQAGCKAKSRRNPLWIPRLFNVKSGCVCRNRRYFRLFRYTLAQRRNFPSFRSCIRINSSIIHKYSKSMYKYRIQHFADLRDLPGDKRQHQAQGQKQGGKGQLTGGCFHDSNSSHSIFLFDSTV